MKPVSGTDDAVLPDRDTGNRCQERRGNDFGCREDVGKEVSGQVTGVTVDE